MKRVVSTILIAGVVFWHIVPSACADALLKRTISNLSVVNDYSCKAALNANLPGLVVQGLKLEIFYKRPGKTLVKASEGFAVIPKEGLFFGDPLEELLKNFEPVRLSDEKWNGRMCVRYALRPKTDSYAPLAKMRLYLDKASALPAGFTGVSPQGRQMTTIISFSRFQGKYWLPVETRMIIRGGAQRTDKQKGADVDGRATVKFSGYKINQGLPDSLFPAGPGRKVRDLQ